MYTAVQGVSWSKGTLVSDIPITNQDGVAWKVMHKMKLSPFKKSRKKKIWFPFPCGKMDVASCFETIFPTKTLWKLNKIDSAGFIVFGSFVCSSYCLCLCHGNREVIYLYGPFYNNVPFLSTQQRKYQVKPLPLSNYQVNSTSVLQTTHVHSHVRPHAPMLLMKNIQFVNKISVFSACVWVFFW